MKKWAVVLVAAMLLSLTIASCSSSTSPAVAGGTVGDVQAEPVAGTSTGTNSPASDAVLSTSYKDALPVEAQLALGTLQLEGSDLAVTADLAQELLDYWRAMQALAQSDSTAEVELNAVTRQIETGMTSEQIAAIAAMELTEEKVQTMLEEGAIGFGRGAGQGAEGAAAGGGFRGGGPGGFLGGPPSGGGPGGGPGGFGGDPSAFETRQAEMEASGESAVSSLIERAGPGMVVRLLETKTGQAPQRGFGAAFAVAGELTGLSEEEVGQAMAEGQTLAEILQANGLSVYEAKDAMMEAMADVELPPGQDLEQWVDGLLSGSMGQGRQASEATVGQ